MANEQKLSGTSTTILVVDDNPDFLEMVSAALTRAGYRVATAGTGEDALAMMGASRPDLLLCDLELPGMTSREIVERLKRNSAWADIPIVILSGSGNLRELASRMPVDEYAGKSDIVPLTRLLQLVARVLRRSGST